MKRFIVSLCPMILLTAFPVSAGTAAAAHLKPIIIQSERNDISYELKHIRPIPPARSGKSRVIPIGRPPKAIRPKIASEYPPQKYDNVIQSELGYSHMPSPSRSFEGISNLYGVYPPDANGDVGPNHYIQIVNLGFQIWNKSGISLYGPADINTIWSGFGGQCETENDGDPIVLYDHFADRWLISQFALGPSYSGPFYQCIAISQAGDPTGAWYRYAFHYSDAVMNDYPKFGVWPDGYYMSANQFVGNSWAGAGVVALERSRMLNGQPAQMVYFDLNSVNSCFGSLLPSDLDGTPSPAGTPDYFMSFDDGSWACGSGNDNLKIWNFHVDWATPANSTFGLSGQPDAVLNAAPFNLLPCTLSENENCIPQPGVFSSSYLDALGDRLMYRLQYRNFGSYAAMVANHTVDAGGGRAGIRWYELRNNGTGWAIYQQGTYAPSDTEHRWMGSMAMDVKGNIALGYSVSSPSVYPSIRYTGRYADDPLGTMPQSEATIIDGSGSQTGIYGRWGDYSMMGVDPLDGCTFWYTTEYIQNTGVDSWRTRIASFKFPDCTAGPAGTLRGIVRDSNGGNPIIGAAVSEAGGYSTTTNTSGAYQFAAMPAGVYDITASAYGYQAETITGIAIRDGVTTIQDFSLLPRAAATIHGTVIDGSGHGWPLYARIDIAADGYSNTIYTDPVSGNYSIGLYQDIPYTFKVTASGYNTSDRIAAPTLGDNENFVLTKDSSCTAPGYGFSVVYSEDFEDNCDNWTMTGLWHPENQTDACGSMVAPFPSPAKALYYGVDNTCTFNGGAVTSGSLAMITPVLIGADARLNFWSYEATECDGNCGYDKRYVDISTDGGNAWTNIWTSSGPEGSWHRVSIDLSSYSNRNILARFRFDSMDPSYNDFLGWLVDDVVISQGNCLALSGGLAVGNVYAADTGAPINNAKVTDGAGHTATTAATSSDSELDDGFYTLFLPAGSPTLTASYPGYGNDSKSVNVAADSVMRQNFNLAACSYSVLPSNASFGASGGNGSIQVSAGSSCAWTVSNNPSWVSITSGSGTGNGIVTYSVSPNPDISSRTGTMTIAGRPFTVTQAGISHGILQGIITDASTGNPINSGIVIAAGGYSTTTNSSGFYQITNMPVGSYDVTASAYGHQSQTVTGVVIDNSFTTTLNLALNPLSVVIAKGTVTDASGHGWPLYARIDITAEGYSNTIYTDPVTGNYSIGLYQDTPYTFNLTSPGYNSENRNITLPSGGGIENFALNIDLSCTAPGYSASSLYSETFEINNGGFSSSGITTWAWGTPTGGTDGAHSGSHAWATNLSGNYNNNEDGYITSANIDLRSNVGQSTILSWWQWLQSEDGYDYADIEVSNNGGASWSVAYGPASGNADSTWTRHSIALEPSYSVRNFRVRFHFTSDYSVVYQGWYIDDLSLANNCRPLSGGLAIGNIYDAFTGAAIDNATITDGAGNAVTASATQNDPALDDGFYVLFLPAGNVTLTASYTGYVVNSKTINVTPDSVIKENFSLYQACADSPVKLLSSGLTYLTLADACSFAADNDVLEVQAVTLNESLYFNQNKSVTLKGGYNCDYTGHAWNTTINGSLTIGRGTVTAENIVIQ